MKLRSQQRSGQTNRRHTNVDHQTRHLYGLPARRFPERGYRRWESFYTTLAQDEAGQPKTMRHYVAFRSHYMNSTESALLCLEILHQEIRRLYADPLAAIGQVGALLMKASGLTIV